MLNELKYLTRIEHFVIIPLTMKILLRSIDLILKYHIYVADAIQIASCKYVNCDVFLTSDTELRGICTYEGIRCKLV